MAIAIAAIVAEAKRVTIAGRRREISTPVMMGTISNHGDILNVLCKACSIAIESAPAVGEPLMLAMAKTMRAMISEGVVVTIIYRM